VQSNPPASCKSLPSCTDGEGLQEAQGSICTCTLFAACCLANPLALVHRPCPHIVSPACHVTVAFTLPPPLPHAPLPPTTTPQTQLRAPELPEVDRLSGASPLCLPPFAPNQQHSTAAHGQALRIPFALSLLLTDQPPTTTAGPRNTHTKHCSGPLSFLRLTAHMSARSRRKKNSRACNCACLLLLSISSTRWLLMQTLAHTACTISALPLPSDPPWLTPPPHTHTSGPQNTPTNTVEGPLSFLTRST
jgi:hypothetical protein